MIHSLGLSKKSGLLRMFSVCVSTEFIAKHAVTIRGIDETPHNHTWKVEVVIEGSTLDDDGVLIDFIEVEKDLATILDPISGANLNTCEILGGANPSAERVAMYIGDAMSKKVHGDVRVQSVTVTEAPHCKATYSL